ncbi:hypothetical protein BKK51_12960 [Rodentibacter trehalosifermentans]|uniref:DUF2335 domain-containing protein n=1 Tax=Rodentibacter trehalosifermentans TaxID=1908263 RepID=A0A1V3IZP4_9PAST|nr:DUF2335 domain-containing protein [Rodentibacter trehalosifermentans]OOF42312.1 hypothetical protein BKK51_12960 [Rodentibacter trehalosifermentans]OOF47581.1 hypothetical protein BKK52_08625 [Rodentibacter trehalosifermentans]
MSKETNNLEESQEQELIETVAKDPKLLEKLVQTPEVAGVLSIMVQQQISHSGPLPMASEVAKYNEVIPDGANRIMMMAEKEQDANHADRRKQLEQRDQELAQNDVRLKQGQDEIDVIKRGQWISLAVITLFTALSALLAILGDTTSAALLMGAGLVGIVTALIYGKRNKE